MPKPVIWVTIAAVLLGSLIGYTLATQWQTETFGDYVVRHNRLTGLAEVQDGSRWTRFADDPYADTVPAELLRQVHLSDIAWGPDGLLCARATNRSNHPLTGRIAFRIILLRNDKIFRDRALRATVNFLPGQTHAVILRTNLTTPDAIEKNLATRVSLQPAAYSGI